MPFEMMPAGRYWVGDLCYVMQDPTDTIWQEFCNLTCLPNGEVRDGKTTLANGLTVWAATTMFGDGTYRDYEGYRYPVDAGLIGCVDLDELTNKLHQPTADDLKLGRIVVMDKPFRCERDEDGTFFIGDVTIETGEIWNDDDYEEDEEDEDDNWD